jgi:hypothetical protein
MWDEQAAIDEALAVFSVDTFRFSFSQSREPEADCSAQGSLAIRSLDIEVPLSSTGVSAAT